MGIVFKGFSGSEELALSLKLSAQLDDAGDPDLPFKLYQSYIQHNKWRLPESVLGVINNPDWTGGSTSRAPYYSDLVELHLDGAGSDEAALRITLLKHMYLEIPLRIVLKYEGLFELVIPEFSNISEYPLVWRYEQFLYFDAYKSHGIKDRLFTHQIEWTDGRIWSITARNIRVEWVEVSSGETVGNN